ncbi:9241_t:CDS:10 [Ambispora gerdemannii]|uniref:9241_t:CDS:1 n=1 Tax=Ambispora gerdemannii TaxID=144530 RepID=A0A9N8VBV7_9GLOM|nr:9241_t:CDS:10 [Ambispora gerdemannii]
MISYLEWLPTTINNLGYNNNNNGFLIYPSTASARPRQSMFVRWMSRVPKIDKYSLENLRHLGDLLEQYIIDTYDDEKIVETIKEITQILIWGDQHKPAILEYVKLNRGYFFEQDMHYDFLRILEMTKSPLVTKQLLQTMNILFENIHDLTSLCEYSEAIKFFNSEESMIRVAVRTVTLNIFAVNDMTTQEFILDRKVAPYFSNLVYFIANHASTMNELSKEPYQNHHHSKIDYYIAEHSDIFYYINDIINLNIEKINEVLTHHLVELLLKPFYADSLVREELLPPSKQQVIRISPVIALALLCHVLHIFRYQPLVTSMVAMLFSDTSHELNYATPPSSLPSSEHTSSMTSGSRNLYREAILDFLTPDEESDDSEFCDLATLPALCLIYMSCRNHAIAPEVLINTAVYPQKLLMETLTSSSGGLLNDLSFSIDTVSMASSVISSLQEKTFFSETGERTEKSDALFAAALKQSAKNENNHHHDHKPRYNNMVIPEIRIFFADDDYYDDVKNKNENNHNHIETLASPRVNYRRELISKLVLILCEHYNRCRPITLQMATELLLELIYYDGSGESLSDEQTRMMAQTECNLQEDMKYYFVEYPNFPLELVESALMESKFNGDKLVGNIIMDAKILFPPLPPVPPPPISITPSRTPPVQLKKDYREDEDILQTLKTLHLIRQCRKLLSRQGRSASDREFDTEFDTEFDIEFDKEDRQDPDSNDVQDNDEEEDLMFQDDETQQERLQNAKELSSSATVNADDAEEAKILQRKKEVLDILGIQHLFL